MDLRSSKMLYLGLPTLLLVLYIVFVPAPSVSKIHVQDNLGYIAEGYDFTILNLYTPSQITAVSSYTLPYRIRNFTIENEIAYVVTGDNSIHIIDTDDPINLSKVADWTSPSLVHSVAVEGNFVFLANHTDGVRVLNIQEPSQPYELPQISNIGTVLDVAASQNFIYVARGSDGLDIYDISNISKPERKGHYDAGNPINRVTLLPDGKALLQVGRQDLQIINLSNPQNIILTNTFTTDNEIIKAVVNGNRLFVAQKRAGVVIVRIKEDSTLEEQITINTPPYTIRDVASLDNIIFMATGPGGILPADISKLDTVQFMDKYTRFFKYKGVIVVIVIAALLFWLAFFAQFVLPVRTFHQRQKIFSRLIIFLLGRHGPATLVENGEVRARRSERQRKGPGVLWLDTASATVVRTATKFKEAIGPGVHFTEKKEFITGTVDLHTQVDSLGLSDDEDDPFMEQPGVDADQTEKGKFEKIQKQRMQVSGLTRDGIEVVPKISVTFRVDTLPVEGNQRAGSRFGYRTGTSKKDKENEAKDKEAIYHAITGEGINPNVPTETPRHRVAWNHLPILLAVDVWREYVAKFTLDELFTATQEMPLSITTLPQLTDAEIGQLSEPIQVSAKKEPFQEFYESILHELNKIISGWLEFLEGKKTSDDEKPKTEPSSSPKTGDASMRTALQVINDMVKARLTLQEVEELDSTGHRIQQTKTSSEYTLLSKRGLKVISVSISNPRVDQVVEKQLISQWTASWLNNARAERDRIERQRGFVEIQGEQQGINEYTHILARHIIRLRPNSPKDIIKALLMRTQLIIVKNDQLQRRMGTEREDLEEILQFVENT